MFHDQHRPSPDDRLANIERLAADMNRKLDILLGVGLSSLIMETKNMTLLDDAQAKEDAALAAISANTDRLSSVKAALDAQTAKITDLQAQLAAAIANGSDPAAIQAVLDKATAILAATDTQATAEAALLNTPA